MKALFKVLDFYRDQDTNILTVDLDCNRCHIPLSQFEKWLDRTDRLEWVHDWSDNTGEHCQETGRYSISQYWQMSAKQIQHDIYEFIVIHFTNPLQGIINSLNQITNEYAAR